MALTLEEALNLKEGVILSFGSEYQYFVVAVESRDHGRGVHLTLKRDDGFDTHATHHDLHKATIGTKPTVADAPEAIVIPNVTAELPPEPYDVVATTTNSVTDEVTVSTIHIDPAVVNVFPAAELPSEPPPTETASKDQDGDDTAVDNKPASKGKRKGKNS